MRIPSASSADMHPSALAAINRHGLPVLPHDLLITVYGLLDVDSAVALSKTCRSMHDFAVSRPAWLVLARTLAVTRALALPAEKQAVVVPAELTTDEMRTAVQRTTRLASNLIKPNPVLNPVLALALPEETTVVHASLLPGARFLLTTQHGGTFACWDLAVTEPVTPAPHPGLPRRRSMQTQTHSADGVDVETGSESGDECDNEDDADSREGLRRPRCVARWETGAEYVEFAYDPVPGGVLVALMVAIQVGQDPPILKRDMYVARIDLPIDTAPHASRPTFPSSSSTPPMFDGRHHGLTFLAHSPLRQPVFIATTFINASGHAGILGDIPDTMVLFILLFDPLTPSSSTRCASSLIHCGFKCAPGTRYTALGTPTHVLLYAESASKTLARRINVQSMRRRWASSPVSSECVDLGVKLLGTPKSRMFVGSPGTEGAPFFTTVRVTLRKDTPRWLRRDGADVRKERSRSRRGEGKGKGKGKNREEAVTVCAMGLSVDVENRATDVFRGVALGAHDIEPDSESDSGESDSEDSLGYSSGPKHSFLTVPSNMSDSYSLPTPSQSSLIEEPVPSTAVQSEACVPAPLHRPFRRDCRVRYKRTIFPTHVNYAHELAGIGSFGRYAAWIEGDGVPEQTDWEKEPLRVVVAPLTWESGSEPRSKEADERSQAGKWARVVDVPASLKEKLNLVTCVALEDAVGALAMATMHGQVFVCSLVG